MTDIILGLVAVVAGLVFCFGGYLVMRMVFPIWGAFAGFAFGAGLVSGLADERFLGSVLGWVLGIVFGLVFAIFAYLYYAVAVVLAMGAIGFALGSALMVALGVTWDWVIVFVAMALALVLGGAGGGDRHAVDRAGGAQCDGWRGRGRGGPDADVRLHRLDRTSAMRA